MNEKELIEVYGQDAIADFASEEAKREQRAEEKAEIEKRIAANEAERRNRERVRAEIQFREGLKQKFLSISSFATEKDFDEIYPELRRQYLIDSMKPTPEGIEGFNEEFN